MSHSMCQNCGEIWPNDDLGVPRRLTQRVAPGEPHPSGECPDCGALCQPVPEDNIERDWPEARFIVHRESYEERTFAIVTANIHPDKPELTKESGFLKALEEAIAKWIETDKVGRATWEYANEDFNVGDLSLHYHDRPLRVLLFDQGIKNLEVETHVYDGNGPWTFDTNLAWGVDLSEEEEEVT